MVSRQIDVRPLMRMSFLRNQRLFQYYITSLSSASNDYNARKIRAINNIDTESGSATKVKNSRKATAKSGRKANSVEIDVWGEDEIRRHRKQRQMSDEDKALADWFTQHSRRGWSIYFLTFLFSELYGSEKVLAYKMFKQIERFYSGLLVHMMHHPNRRTSVGRRPILIAVPEKVWRRSKRAFRLADVLPNDGWHAHAVLLVPPSVRAKTKPFDAFFERERDKFVKPHAELRSVHVQRMDDQSRRVWSYIMKTRFRSEERYDDILWLPAVKSDVAYKEVIAEERAATVAKTARLKAARLARDAAASSKGRDLAGDEWEVSVPPTGTVMTRYAAPKFKGQAKTA